MQTKIFQMTLKAGLYTEWANLLVKKAMEYQSNMKIQAFQKCIDLKSIMGILSLGICRDTEITIIAEGKDEKEAIQGVASQILLLNLGIEKN